MSTEPITVNTAIKEALSAVLKVLVIMGVVVWSAEQTAAILLAVDALLAVVLLLWQARNRSTSIAAPRVPLGTTVTVYDESGEDVGTMTGPVFPVNPGPAG